jgi:hypothetical protein
VELRRVPGHLDRHRGLDHRQETPALHDHPVVHHDRVHRRAVLGVDRLLEEVVARREDGPAQVEHDEIGPDPTARAPTPSRRAERASPAVAIRSACRTPSQRSGAGSRTLCSNAASFSVSNMLRPSLLMTPSVPSATGMHDPSLST